MNEKMALCMTDLLLLMLEKKYFDKDLFKTTMLYFQPSRYVSPYDRLKKFDLMCDWAKKNELWR